MRSPILPDVWYRPTDDALRALGCVGTLKNWRHQGAGPAFHKLGTGKNCRVAYHGRDLLDWLEARRVVRPTAA